MQFTLVTGSEKKVMEYQMMLPGIMIETAKIDVDEIQSMDLEDIALKKARAVHVQLGKPVVVDDTGFFLEHWKGLPGPFIKYFEERFPNDSLARLLGDTSDRRGYAKCCIAYCDGEREFVVCGEAHGTVTHEARGPAGAFGFDYYFIPNGYNKTFAELEGKKHMISHRFRALQAFRKELERTDS